MEANRVTIDVDHDGMSASASVKPGAGDAAGDSVRTALAEACVVEGIDDDAIAALAEELRHAAYAAAGVVVALGKEPQHGRDARFELDSDTNPTAGRPRADGTIDYRERSTIRNVASGVRLGRWFAPTPGTPGRTVCGAAIPARPGEALELLGDGVVVDDASGVIRAARDGVVVHVPDRFLDVSELFELDRDVDYRTGNLDVCGAVRVHGDVRPNFTVLASGFVDIDGIVDDARVEAGANLRIEGGVIGRGFARIEAGGDAYVHHASHVPIDVQGTLELGDHVVDCSVRAAAVLAENGRGSIVGGATLARTEIHARSAGSPREVDTELAVAIAHDERRAHRRRERRAERDLRRAAKRDANDAKRAKSGRERHRRRSNLERAARRLAELENDLLDAASIEVLQTAHAGVRIRFGHHVLKLTEALERTRFRFDRTQDCIILEKARS